MSKMIPKNIILVWGLEDVMVPGIPIVGVGQFVVIFVSVEGPISYIVYFAPYFLLTLLEVLGSMYQFYTNPTISLWKGMVNRIYKY
jgi:hypothetical protein